jgi:hypothetical protein
MRIAPFALLAVASISLPAQKFFHDDPLIREPAPMNVDQLLKRKFSDYFDFFYSTFGKPGEQHRLLPVPVPAKGVNTLGEPMAGAWWEPRHYYRRMSIEELVRGPGNSNPPAPGNWVVVSAKSEGITPGFKIEDREKRVYHLKFDPVSNPEIASSPDVLVGKIFYALGYHVPENYIVEFSPEQLIIQKGTKLTDRLGKERPMTGRDVTEILLNVPKSASGKYRALASRNLEGVPLGPYRYWGTRKDDPNDTVPHEHRRDLRGLSLACAWLGHDDSRSINTIDFVVEENGRKFVKHHLIDFGSTLGSATDKPNSPRSGFEYLFEWKPAITQFASLGLAVPAWARAKYPRLPSVGTFEYEKFDPLLWRAEYPNPAFSNRLPEDEFWMAKQIAAFTDAELEAIVKTGQYSDPKAAEWILKCLIERRNKITKAFLPRVLPLDRFRVENGSVTFDHLGERHGTTSIGALRASWSHFDNATGATRSVAGANSFRIPSELANVSPGGFARLEIASEDEPSTKVEVYLRKRGEIFEVVGLNRSWKIPIIPKAP